MDMQVGHAGWTCGMDIKHRHSAGTCSMDMRHRQAAWTCGMNMQHENVAWTCSKDIKEVMQHGLYMNKDSTLMYTYTYMYKNVHFLAYILI
jgi:hypothetical protein